MKRTFWILAAAYFARHWNLLRDSNLYLNHDNLGYHFPSFLYFANSIALGFGIPKVLYEYGGSEIAMTSISMGYFTPHRIAGYLLYLLVPIKPLLAYKLSLIVGFIINAFGWHLLWTRTLPHRNLALVGDLLLFGSGIGLTILHQEQMLMTVSWLPWALFFAVYAVQETRSFALAGACAGGLLTLHYPQIHMVGLLFIILSLGICSPKDYCKNFSLPLLLNKSVLQGVLSFLLALAPTIYIFFIKSDYASPVRASQNIGNQSLSEYFKVNLQQQSSGTLRYIMNVILPAVDRGDDQMAFYITEFGFFLAIVGVLSTLLYYRRWRFLIPLMLLSAWATLGVNGYLAQILFSMRFFGISLFRQWYHFVPYFIISLITLACLGFGWIRMMILKLYPAPPSYLTWPIVIIAGAWIFISSNHYYNEYIERYQIHVQTEVPRFSENDFLYFLNHQWMDSVLPIPFSVSLVARKDAFAFFESCPSAFEAMAWSLKGPPPDDKNKSVNWCQLLAESKNKSLTRFSITPGSRQLQQTFLSVSFGPGSIRLEPQGSGPEYVAVALHPDLFESSADPEPIRIADNTLSVFKVDRSATVPFKGKLFLMMLALQLLSVLVGGWLTLRPGSISSQP